jgi:hypothetical protein
MDKEIKDYIDGVFTDFKAGCSRFLDTQIKAYIQSNVRSIIHKAIHEQEQAIITRLNNNFEIHRDDISVYDKNINLMMRECESRMKSLNKASHELKSLFSLVRNINNKIEKFYDRKRTSSTPAS